ncbi:MAG: type II toxin-antitoxin system HicB family antitoxin [Chloroflexi bacterium]|nr:MAG: type II toxin-antitoxin system HicB family antitoxin [Chloroflexota bacterium]
MATVFRVRAVLEPDEDGFHAFCPGLPGCHTWGSTKAEALENLREAASLYLESLIAHGEPIPVESHGPSSSSVTEEDFTVSV